MQKVTCPECGKSDNINVTEDIQNCREVIGVEDGVLKIQARYEIPEGFDEGQNTRFVCRSCCHEFPIPEEIELEWV